MSPPCIGGLKKEKKRKRILKQEINLILLKKLFLIKCFGLTLELDFIFTERDDRGEIR